MHCKKVYPVLSESNTQEVYDEMLGKVVWDQEMSAELDINSDLLQLLASSGGYRNDKTKPTIEMDIDEVLTHVAGSSLFLECIIDVADHVLTELDLTVETVRKIACGQALVVENTMEHTFHPQNMWIPGGSLLLQGCALGPALIVLAEMPCQEHTHQLPAWRNNGFSPGGEKLVESKSLYFPAKLFDPGVLRLTFIYMQPDMMISSLVTECGSQFMIKAGGHLYCCSFEVNASELHRDESICTPGARKMLQELCRVKDFCTMLILASELVCTMDKNMIWLWHNTATCSQLGAEGLGMKWNLAKRLYSRCSNVAQNVLEQMQAWKYNGFSPGESDEGHEKMSLLTILKLEEGMKHAALVQALGSQIGVKLRTFRRALKGLLQTLASVRTDIQKLEMVINGNQIHMSFHEKINVFGCYLVGWFWNRYADCAICRTLFHPDDALELLLVILSIIRQWDPGGVKSSHKSSKNYLYFIHGYAESFSSVSPDGFLVESN